MYTLGSVSSVANFITAYEESIDPRVVVYFFFPKAIFFTFISLALR